jgi:hypothetical protein
MKEYICYLCNKIFTTKSNLNRHLHNTICASNIDVQLYIHNLKKEILFLKTPNCKEESSICKTSAYKYKKYIMPSGKIINYQGYENLALDELIKIYKEDDIENERHKVPTIIYFKNSKEYNYYPDIYIKSKNLIIEVKSDWTYKKQLIENILKVNNCYMFITSYYLIIF